MPAAPMFKLLRDGKYVASFKVPEHAVAVMWVDIGHPRHRWTLTKGYRGSVLYDTIQDGYLVDYDGALSTVERRLREIVGTYPLPFPESQPVTEEN